VYLLPEVVDASCWLQEKANTFHAETQSSQRRRKRRIN